MKRRFMRAAAVAHVRLRCPGLSPARVFRRGPPGIQCAWGGGDFGGTGKARLETGFDGIEMSSYKGNRRILKQ